jgi:hypothetical protein
MRIGYAKLGRSMTLDVKNGGPTGGDLEPLAVLHTLAKKRPDDDFILVGRNSGEYPNEVDLPNNVFNPWHHWNARIRSGMRHIDRSGVDPQSLERKQMISDLYREITAHEFENLDAMILWLGQHNSVSSPIPSVKDRDVLVRPQDSALLYSGFLLQGINAWRDVDPWNREEIVLVSDPRNYHKLRDLKWPLRHKVLAQYEYSRQQKLERYGDPEGFEEWSGHDFATIKDPNDIDKVWVTKTRGKYSRIELNSLVPGTPSGDMLKFDDNWEGREPFGLFINEARAITTKVELTRAHIMKEWVMPLKPAFVHGKWDLDTYAELGINITPKPWAEYVKLLPTVRATFTTPSSGSGWATTKPWEAFAAGVVCFFHPVYDDQNNILGDAPDELGNFLRVRSKEELAERVNFLSAPEGRIFWLNVVRGQRMWFDYNVKQLHYLQMIEDRLDTKGTMFP